MGALGFILCDIVLPAVILLALELVEPWPGGRIAARRQAKDRKGHEDRREREWRVQERRHENEWQKLQRTNSANLDKWRQTRALGNKEGE